jgi:hypothetical protein
MQKVVAYLLERREEMGWPAARAAEVKRLQAEVTKWLTVEKGASAIGPTGIYKPEDGSKGTYKLEEAVDGDRTWWMLHLEEETAAGRIVVAAVSITAGVDKVAVYATVEAGWTTSHIVPGSMDMRCPKIVRSLLGLPGRWYHGTSTLRPMQAVGGFDDGEALAAEIEHPGRTVPILVVSRIDGEIVLPDLDSKLAYDLAGLANVAVLDEDASWALTDILGASFSCYRGAVRLFWPQFSTKQDCFLHPLWTATRLRSSPGEATATRDRFRRQLRELVFHASALSVTRPREIDEIRDTAGRRIAAELRERATSLDEYKALADSYAGDNDQLRAERAQLRSQIEDLQKLVAKHEGDRKALLQHLAAKDAAGEPPSEGEEIAPCTEDDDSVPGPPSVGETRFYKKVHSRSNYDVMIRTQDCGCNHWQTSHAADKARKGIARLEGGRSDWQSMQHCATCTGGGMWRVRW